MKHPGGRVLDILKTAGLPDSQLHDVAGEIRQAYDEANEDDRASENRDPFAGWRHLEGQERKP